MNNVQETSLALMRNYLNNVSDDDFLADYLEAEDCGGITVDEFFNNTSSIASISAFGVTFMLENMPNNRLFESTLHGMGMQSIKITHSLAAPRDSTFAPSANDAVYGYSLAA
ncbi:hypothetical protein [Thiothrix subterranea]|uniref:Uncharacterized protein n=1 Tax=Thiothrix subterranea TaxID=2735563 RepID=A0AA51MQW2_9GAMM|nr:hypothetical protein [Thiothrix subterranea]MDQ5768493.1 hypothetical protein [Thiothrix subterranea]WML87626.1 hypothetical protein RCG00_04500 [Thiothrix subterranea]